MQQIQLFSQQLKEREVGHKAYQLSRVFKTFNVPHGFILTTHHFQYFLSPIREKIDRLLNDLPLHDEDKFQDVVNQIQKLIMTAKIPNDLWKHILEFYTSLNIEGENVHKLIGDKDHPLVAVRSSSLLPPQQFFHYSTLNVRGERALEEAIKITWASLYTKKSVKYHLNNDEPFLMGVIIQRMIDADLSGKAYFKDANTIVVQGAYGLGEAIQKEIINPDIYKLKKESLEITQRNIAEQEVKLINDSNGDKTITIELPTDEARSQKLKDKHIREAALLCKRVTNNLQEPCMIEFCIKRDKMFLLQVDTQNVIMSYDDQVEEQSWPVAVRKDDSEYKGAKEHMYDPNQDLFEELPIAKAEEVDQEKEEKPTPLEYVEPELPAQNAEEDPTPKEIVETDLPPSINESVPKEIPKDQDDAFVTPISMEPSQQDESNIVMSDVDGKVIDDQPVVNPMPQEMQQEDPNEGAFLLTAPVAIPDSPFEGVINEPNEYGAYIGGEQGNDDENEKEEEPLEDPHYIEDKSEEEPREKPNGEKEEEPEESQQDEEKEDSEESQEEDETEEVDLIEQDEDNNVEEGGESDDEEESDDISTDSRNFVISCYEKVKKKLTDFHYEKTNFDGELEFEKLLEDLRDYIEDFDSLEELNEIYLKLNERNPQLAEVSTVAQTTQGFFNTFPKQ